MAHLNRDAPTSLWTISIEGERLCSGCCVILVGVLARPRKPFTLIWKFKTYHSRKIRLLSMFLLLKQGHVESIKSKCYMLQRIETPKSLR